MFYIRHILRSQ